MSSRQWHIPTILTCCDSLQGRHLVVACLAGFFESGCDAECCEYLTGANVYSPIDNTKSCPVGCPLCYVEANGSVDCKDTIEGTTLFHVDSLADLGLSPTDTAVLDLYTAESTAG